MHFLFPLACRNMRNKGKIRDLQSRHLRVISHLPKNQLEDFMMDLAACILAACWNRQPRGVVESPSLAVLRIKSVAMALGDMV